MTELERRALMGDKKAQADCTRQGIILPCPFCGGNNIITTNWGMFRTWCQDCRGKSDDQLTWIDAVKAWNTRQAPPIGRCDGCVKRYEDETGVYFAILYAQNVETMTFVAISNQRSVKKMRLIDADTVGNEIAVEWQKVLVKSEVNSAPTIDPETLPIVQELRAELENRKQEFRQVKYCYDIAKNSKKQLRKQNDEITAAWAECAKKLNRATAERDEAVICLKLFTHNRCDFCKWYNKPKCTAPEPCGVNDNWEWRGIKNENQNL